MSWRVGVGESPLWFILGWGGFVVFLQIGSPVLFSSEPPGSLHVGTLPVMMGLFSLLTLSSCLLTLMPAALTVHGW